MPAPCSPIDSCDAPAKIIDKQWVANDVNDRPSVHSLKIKTAFPNTFYPVCVWPTGRLISSSNLIIKESFYGDALSKSGKIRKPNKSKEDLLG